MASGGDADDGGGHGAAYYSDWQQVDARTMECKTELRRTVNAVSILDAADRDDAPFLAVPAEQRRARARSLRNELVKLTREAMLLSALDETDAGGVMRPSSDSLYTLADVMDAAFKAGPNRLPDVVKLCALAREQVRDAAAKCREVLAGALEEASDAVVANILRNEADGTAYFSQLEPWVASSVFRVRDKDGGVAERADFADCWRKNAATPLDEEDDA